MKIFAKMAAILAEFPVVSKDQRNNGFGGGYDYRGIDDALAALHPLLAKHGVFMALTGLEPEYHPAGTTKSGAALVRCVLTGAVRFYADDASFVEVSFVGEGVDGVDKAMMKAQANGLKYVCWYTFCVPTKEKKDSEAFEDPEIKDSAPAPARTKRAAKPSTLTQEWLLEMSTVKSASALSDLWLQKIRPEVTRMPADSLERAQLVEGFKKKQAELAA